jgi:hypothetical protein
MNREDVAGVIKANRESLDDGYQQSWIRHSGLTDSLSKAAAGNDESDQ